MENNHFQDIKFFWNISELLVRTSTFLALLSKRPLFRHMFLSSKRWPSQTEEKVEHNQNQDSTDTVVIVMKKQTNPKT